MSENKKPSEMSFGELRKYAMGLKIDTSGKKQPDLLREVEKTLAAANGKGTPADPHPKKTAPTPPPAGTTPAAAPKERPAAGATPPAAPAAPGRAKEGAATTDLTAAMASMEKLGSVIESFEPRVETLEGDVGSLIETVGGFPALLRVLGRAISALASAVGEEENPDVKALSDLLSGSGGESESLDISEAELDKMDLEALKNVAKILNEKKDAKIDIDVKSARVLRERIKTALTKVSDEIVSDSKLTAAGGSKEVPRKRGADKTGDVEEEEEVEEEDEPEEIEVEAPFAVGQEVEVDFGSDGWKRGKVTAVYVEADPDTDSDAESCDVEIGEETVGAGWSEIRVYVAPAPKAKVKTKAKLSYHRDANTIPRGYQPSGDFAFEEIMANPKSNKRFFKKNVLDMHCRDPHEGDTFTVRALAVRAKKLPVVKVKLTNFTHVIESLTSRVWGNITTMGDFAEHFDRTERADLRVPIMVRAKNGNVLDGHHRIVKAFVRHKKFINVVYFEEHHLPFPII